MRKINFRAAGIGSGIACGVFLNSAYAVDFDTGLNDLSGSWTSNVTAGAGIRTKDPSCSLTGDPNAYGCGAAANTAQWANGDDGDLNYKKGQAYSTYLSVTSELLLTMPSEGYKLMIRGTGMYDFLAADTERTSLSTDAEDQAVRDVDLLDFWVEKDFPIDGQNAHVRLGNQVINWGESYFAMSGINATNSLDIQKLLIPGTQLKQALLPAPMLSFASNLPAQWSTEAYYQFRWNGDRLPPVGTFWSTSDSLGRGAGPITINTNNVNEGGTDAGTIAGGAASNTGVVNGINQGLVNGVYAGPPTNSFGIPVSMRMPSYYKPQYGIKFGYSPSNLNATFGFYYENYTDKTPVISGLPNGSEQYSYLENRQLFGVSVNFPLRDWAIGAELSYRPHDAVALSTCYGAGGPLDSNTNGVSGIQCQQYADQKKLQLDVNSQLLLSQSEYPFLKLIHADSAVLTAEATWIYYPGIRSNETFNSNVNGQNIIQVLDAGYSTSLSSNGLVTPGGTASSVGLTVDFNWTYDGSLIPGWQVTPGITFTDGVYGHTPTLLANYQQGAKSINVYVLFNQNPTVWQAGINFSAFFGGNALSQPFADRNFVGLFATRNF